MVKRDVAFGPIFIIMCLFCYTSCLRSGWKSFNVDNYGAVGDGKTDSTKALNSSWYDACKWRGKAQVVVPRGTYLVKSLTLGGPCKGPLDFQIIGALKAYDSSVQPNEWIQFQYLDKFSIYGGGSFDGQGHKSWPMTTQDISTFLPTSLGLYFVNNSRIENTKLMNSKGSHMKVFGCNHIELNKLTILAPGDSPNTDGINIAYSTNISVSNSQISTGDDCISLLAGAQDINITGITCGPGHGISIGSMGGESNEAPIERVSVKHCNFTNTLNGVRIKTWATMNEGVASFLSFQDIFVLNSTNPIIIDQNYCPSHHCPKGDSHVEIKNVKFTDIRGDSKSRVAVNFQCSKYKPCQVETRNIDLKYNGDEGPITSLCLNVKGIASGLEKPPSCFFKHYF